MESSQLNGKESSVIREEINLQYHWYMSLFFIVYFGSFIIPGIVFMTYIMLFYLPFFLEIPNLLLIFRKVEPILASIFMPFVIIVCYLIHMFFAALITRIIWRKTEKISPSKSGIIPRNFRSKTLNYYHIRSFIIKYPKNAAIRGPFPWLINWIYNFIGANNIGKGTTLEENIGADRFVKIGNNSYIGVKGAISSHVVEGIFGNLSYFRINIGNNVTAAAFNCIAPGVEINDNSWILPLSGATKFNILKGNNYYFGTPLRRIFKKKVMNYLKISEKDFERAENLKYQQRNTNLNNQKR
jgi:acetyltransferase-like isoleucine patch superfamily enzyme